MISYKSFLDLQWIDRIVPPKTRDVNQMLPSQGIIPMQDTERNALDGGRPANLELLGKMGEVQREANGVRNEITKLEEYLEKMMEAVERNVGQVRFVAAAGEDIVPGNGDVKADDGGSRDGYFDTMIELSAHLSTVNELLKKHNEHVKFLANRQADGDKKLRSALEDINSKRRNDYFDMSHLFNHLDRIQSMIESNVAERKDSVRELTEAQRAPQIDFSPLTDRLERVQGAVEQNSALVKALLEESAAPKSRSGTPFWSRDVPPQQPVDLSPLTEPLEKVCEAIDEQGNHIQALVGFASGDGNDGTGTSAGDTPEKSLAPLGEHLEQIYNAIQQGNACVKDVGDRLTMEDSSHPLQQILEEQKATHEAIETADPRSNVDAVGEKLDTVIEHLESLREWTEYQSEHVKELLDLQKSEEGRAVSLARDTLDFSPVTDRLDLLVDTVDKQSNLNLSPLEKHLESIHVAAQENAAATKVLSEAREKGTTPSETDFSPLTDRLSRIHSSLEKAHTRDRERDQDPGLGNAKFLMSALTSHLSKIQAVTEQNATAVKALREKHSGSEDKMQIAVAETADQLRALLQRTFTQELNESEYKKENDLRVDAVHSQIRELMGGQREMVDVMRELARSIAAQNKGACGHVVIPPPRKMGRKVVGFVYDAKEAPV